MEWQAGDGIYRISPSEFTRHFSIEIPVPKNIVSGSPVIGIRPSSQTLDTPLSRKISIRMLGPTTLKNSTKGK
jgi:hypothetical protein